MAKRRRRQPKGGQAAMEFLMTYGWAILVVLIVIGALAYFGILNPQSFLPKRCLLGSGLSCVDSKIDSAGTFDLIITNGLGNAIILDRIELDDSKLQTLLGQGGSGDGICFTVDPCGGAAILPGENSCLITVDCDDLVEGSRVKTKLIAVYSDQATGFDHTQRGEAILDVEPAP